MSSEKNEQVKLSQRQIERKNQLLNANSHVIDNLEKLFDTLDYLEKHTVEEKEIVSMTESLLKIGEILQEEPLCMCTDSSRETLGSLQDSVDTLKKKLVRNPDFKQFGENLDAVVKNLNVLANVDYNNKQAIAQAKADVQQSMEQMSQYIPQKQKVVEQAKTNNTAPSNTQEAPKKVGLLDRMKEWVTPKQDPHQQLKKDLKDPNFVKSLFDSTSTIKVNKLDDQAKLAVMKAVTNIDLSITEKEQDKCLSRNKHIKEFCKSNMVLFDGTGDSNKIKQKLTAKLVSIPVTEMFIKVNTHMNNVVGKSGDTKQTQSKNTEKSVEPDAKKSRFSFDMKFTFPEVSLDFLHKKKSSTEKEIIKQDSKNTMQL